ncbi:MAG: hypothetical protein IPH66_08345 [Crocinitomicaceae bacterium]|nr:hypothetical protein [Crocinitomicaceae bacterium]
MKNNNWRIKTIFVIASFFINHLCYTQDIFLTPIVGLKADLTRIPFYERHLVIPDYTVIDEHEYWFTLNPKPVLGVRVDYMFKRSTISTGILFNDHVNSRYEFSFMAIQNGQNIQVRKEINAGLPVIKIPLTYQYQWFETANKKFAFNFHLGFNFLMIYHVVEPYRLLDTETYTLAEGYSAGQEIEISSFIMGPPSFGQSKLKTTVDLGFNLSFNISESYHINTMFYFEKGFRHYGVNAVETSFTMGGNRVHTISSGSSGTALHFKVAIPILMKNFNTVQK